MTLMSVGASAIDLLASKPNPSEWSAGLWKWRGAGKAPGPGCAAQNGSATSSSSARRTRGTGNAMAGGGGRLSGTAAHPLSLSPLPPRREPNKIAPPFVNLSPSPSTPREQDENEGKASGWQKNGVGYGCRGRGRSTKRWKTDAFLLWFLPAPRVVSSVPVTPAAVLFVTQTHAPLALGKCNGVNGIFASLSLVVWGLDSVVSSKPKSGIWRGWQDRAADLSGQLHSLLRSAVVALGVRVGASVVPKLPRERG